MSVLDDRFPALVGERVLVVMSDERSFEGELVEFDSDWLVLHDVAEGRASNLHGFEEPTIRREMVEKHVTRRGVVRETGEGDEVELILLKEVLLRLDGILRVWPLEGDNVGRPEHVHVDDASGSDNVLTQPSS